MKTGIIDEVVPEPLGGAHRNPQVMAETIKEVIRRNLKELNGLSKEQLLAARYKKFREIGKFV
jgi:acetyl-CoA carboxylase carboxyl transferase subunit alpha